MARGRKPKPARQKKRTGNPGHRRLATDPPAPRGMPDCPPELTNAAKVEWNRIAANLHRMGLLSSIDRACLAAYCQEWGIWIQSVEMVKKEGTVRLIQKNKKDPGYYLYNPHLAIANKALGHMQSLLSEMGLSPTARARLGSAVAAKPGPVRPDGPDYSHYLEAPVGRSFQ